MLTFSSQLRELVFVSSFGGSFCWLHLSSCLLHLAQQASLPPSLTIPNTHGAHFLHSRLFAPLTLHRKRCCPPPRSCRSTSTGSCNIAINDRPAGMNRSIPGEVHDVVLGLAQAHQQRHSMGLCQPRHPQRFRQTALRQVQLVCCPVGDALGPFFVLAEDDKLGIRNT